MEAIMQVFENLEKRKKRREHVVERSTSHPGDDGDPETPTTDVEEVKLEPAAEEEPLPSEARTPQPVLAGVSTRQTSQLGVSRAFNWQMGRCSMITDIGVGGII